MALVAASNLHVGAEAIILDASPGDPTPSTQRSRPSPFAFHSAEDPDDMVALWQQLLIEENALDSHTIPTVRDATLTECVDSSEAESAETRIHQDLSVARDLFSKQGRSRPGYGHQYEIPSPLGDADGAISSDVRRTITAPPSPAQSLPCVSAGSTSLFSLTRSLIASLPHGLPSPLGSEASRGDSEEIIFGLTPEARNTIQPDSSRFPASNSYPCLFGNAKLQQPVSGIAMLGPIDTLRNGEKEVVRTEIVPLLNPRRRGSFLSTLSKVLNRTKKTRRRNSCP